MDEEDKLEDNNELDSEENTPSEVENDTSQETPVEGQASTGGPGMVSGITAIVRWFLRLPTSIKGAILGSLEPICIFLVMAFFALMLMAAATGLAEEFRGAIQEIGVTVSDTFDKLGNLFTGKGFNTDQEAAEKMEIAYYNKLDEIYEKYYNELGVQIDTTLITATLFSQRYIGDYVDEDNLTNEDADETDDVFNQDYEFYKQAKKYIKTLAKYQIVEETTFNACSDIPQYVTKPETAKEIADKWDVFNFGYNSRSTFNYVPYTTKTITKADGTQTDIRWCDYEDVNTQLQSYYQEDKDYVNEKKQAYDSCVQDQRQPCIASCLHQYPMEEDPNTGIVSPSDEYRQCVQSCQNQNYDTACASQKSEYEIANNRYHQTWIDEGLYNENGWNSCTSTNLFGSVDPYSDEKYYKNHTFDTSWINNAGEPGFLDEAISWIRGDGGEKIDCSNKPAIQYSYSIDIAREGVYYHKLLSRNTSFFMTDSFIERYYEEYTKSDTPEESYQLAVEIVEDIYDLYEFIADRSSYAFDSSLLCPNGIEVISDGGDPSIYPVGTFNLEDYVAMVVNAENNSGYDEAMKAQIIAARTFALVRTKGCTVPIRNSTNDQVAKANPSDKILQLVAETAGQVLTYQGEMFLSQYDSFDGTCSGSTCTAVYTKLPNGETHTVVIPNGFQKIYGGHGRGMSQVAANYMASQGSTYEEILKYFYSPGVEITTSSGDFSSTVGNGVVLSRTGIVEALAGAGYTLESYSSEMLKAVDNSGVATRSAVLTVARYATSNFYNITGGKKLHYLKVHFASDKTYGFSSPFSKDCSSFVSWVLYNAGFEFESRTSRSWGSVSSKVPASQRSGKPGDLLWNDGHIAIIVGVDDEGYYTAEAHSPSEGLITRHIPFNNPTKYVINMDAWYAQHDNSSDWHTQNDAKIQ